MAFRLEHPFSGAVYAALENGRVEVTKGQARGIFDMRGEWLEGDLRSADPEMIRWVGSNGWTPNSRHLAGFTEQGEDQ